MDGPLYVQNIHKPHTVGNFQCGFMLVCAHQCALTETHMRLTKTELENLYQTLTSKSEQNLFLRRLPINSVLVSSQISDYNLSFSDCL